jgi:DNA-binding transcriptional ArsR family regulator
MTPSELLARIEVSQPTLSHHLDILKRAGLVEAQREGQFIRYSLNMSVFQMAVEYMLGFTKRKVTR